ncbi:MAG: aminopeptidase P N-terminal domain-containing protein [Candidatus Saccharimonadales bacterium]
MFNSNFFKNNRQKLRNIGAEVMPIVISSNGLLQRNSDTSFPFRQDSSFWYFTGVVLPDLLLVISENEDYIITTSRSEIRSTFDGSVDFRSIQKISSVDSIYSEDEGWAKLKKSLRNKVGVIKPRDLYDVNHGIYLNPARSYLYDKLTQHTDLEVVDVSKEIIGLRMIKSAEEITAIKEAIKITSQTFEVVRDRINKCKNESDIDSIIRMEFARNKVVNAYEPIVGSGSNACVLHYLDNNCDIKEGQLVLIDAGAEFENYASDITRTFSRSKPSKRQIEVFNAVKEVQDFALERARSGVTIREYEKKIEQFMGEKLIELGLIKTNTSEHVRKYYPHSTSHHLGLDVHDAADYSVEMSENMVITVEPGIYIAEEKIGIRLEDNVRITKNSRPEVLSKNLPSEL